MSNTSQAPSREIEAARMAAISDEIDRRSRARMAGEVDPLGLSEEARSTCWWEIRRQESGRVLDEQHVSPMEYAQWRVTGEVSAR